MHVSLHCNAMRLTVTSAAAAATGYSRLATSICHGQLR